MSAGGQSVTLPLSNTSPDSVTVPPVGTVLGDTTSEAAPASTDQSEATAAPSAISITTRRRLTVTSPPHARTMRACLGSQRPMARHAPIGDPAPCSSAGLRYDTTLLQQKRHDGCLARGRGRSRASRHVACSAGGGVDVAAGSRDPRAGSQAPCLVSSRHRIRGPAHLRARRRAEDAYSALPSRVARRLDLCVRRR